jgi:hypothetical protein
LPSGRWREVSAEEIQKAFPGAPTAAASPSTTAAPRSADRPPRQRRSG